MSKKYKLKLRWLLAAQLPKSALTASERPCENAKCDNTIEPRSFIHMPPSCTFTRVREFATSHNGTRPEYEMLRCSGTCTPRRGTSVIIYGGASPHINTVPSANIDEYTSHRTATHDGAPKTPHDPHTSDTSEVNFALPARGSFALAL